MTVTLVLENERLYVDFDGLPVFRLTPDGRWVDFYGANSFQEGVERIMAVMVSAV